MTPNTGIFPITSRRQALAARLTAHSQDLYRTEDRALVVYPSRGLYTDRASSLPWGVFCRELWKIPGIHRSHQKSQNEPGGLRQYFQGIFVNLSANNCLVSTQRLCREIITWKHLSHPNILPLLGVSIPADAHCFRVLTQWMPNGNITQYSKSNPAANRMQLVSPRCFFCDFSLTFKQHSAF